MGAVYAGKLFKRTSVAIKLYDTATASRWSVRREIEMNIRINSQHCTQFYGFVIDPENERYAMIFELMTGGNLQDLIFDTEDLFIRTDEVKIKIAYQTALSLVYLHSVGIIHRDVKTSNFLFNKGTYLTKLCDFSISRLMKIHQTADDTGTTDYMAPEEFTLGTPLTEKIDVYAWGVAMWEFFEEESPYHGMSEKEVMKKVSEGYQLQLSTKTPKFMRDLIRKCRSFEPEDRPPFSEIADLIETGARNMSISLF